MKQFVELIISMSTDFLMGKITKETYISNLEMIVKRLKEIEK